MDSHKSDGELQFENDQLREYIARLKAPALLAEIELILTGIDKDEVRDPSGWWETSEGAEFGKARLAKIRALFSQ